jgi:hypothetical protein
MVTVVTLLAGMETVVWDEGVGTATAADGCPEEVRIRVVCVTARVLVNEGKDTGAAGSARGGLLFPSGGRMSKKGL